MTLPSQPPALPLSPKQIEAITDYPEARTVLLHGAVRSGKTLATSLRFLSAIVDAPGRGHILIVGKTLQTIGHNIIAPMQEASIFGPLARHVKYTPGATRARIVGRDVLLFGANDARSEEKIRGITACVALVDEASLVPQSFWQQLTARLSVPGAKLIATTNPGGPKHWLKTEWLDREPLLDMVSWHFTLDDNPSLDPTFVANLKAENTGVFYRRNIEGLWVAAEGAVYPMLDESRHVVADVDVPTITSYVGVGIDYGTTNPTAAVLLGVGVDSRLYVVDEWGWDPRLHSGHQLTDGQLAASLREWLFSRHTVMQPVEPNIPALYVDPAAASLKAELRGQGLPVRDADNDVLPGIKRVGNLLGGGVLQISSRCTGLLGELSGYAWDPRATRRGEDAPIKANDHYCDALRYIAAVLN